MPGRKLDRNRQNLLLQSQLETLAKRVLKKLGALDGKNASVDIILLSGRELGRLKARFNMRNKGKKPDVLAFPEPKNFPHPDKGGERLLGEVFLNSDLARKDLNRLIFLLIHGILHLLGLSHDGKSDTLKMEKLENKLMEIFFLRTNRETPDHK